MRRSTVSTFELVESAKFALAAESGERKLTDLSEEMFQRAANHSDEGFYGKLLVGMTTWLEVQSKTVDTVEELLQLISGDLDEDN